VTVCTNDVARGDLVQDGLPAAVAKSLRDLEPLFAEVVELEHDRVVLAAVGARTPAEELDKVFGTLDRKRLLAGHRLRYVARSIRGIVLAFVVRAALRAVVVPLPTCFATPGESLERQQLQATTTASQGTALASI
jgi:hypothetical protein